MASLSERFPLGYAQPQTDGRGGYVGNTGPEGIERMQGKEWKTVEIHAEAGECGLGGPAEFEYRLKKLARNGELRRGITRGSFSSPSEELQSIIEEADRNGILLGRSTEYEKIDPFYARRTIPIRRLYFPDEKVDSPDAPYIALHGGDRESLTAKILTQVVPQFFPYGFEIVRSHVDYSNVDALTLPHGKNSNGTNRVTYRDITRTDIPYDQALLNLKEQIEKSEGQKSTPKVIWIASVSHSTGEAASRETLETMAKWCDNKGYFLLVDGLWKELAPLENSAATLTSLHKRMAVVETLSGLGMPGLGVSYVVASSDVKEPYNVIPHPYELDACQRTIVDKILEPAIVIKQTQQFQNFVSLGRDSRMIRDNWFQHIKMLSKREENPLLKSINYIRERFLLSQRPHIEISGKGSYGLLIDLMTKVAPVLFPKGFDIVGAGGIQFPYTTTMTKAHGVNPDGSNRVEYVKTYVPISFSLDNALDVLPQQIEKNDMKKRVIYVCNPSTPTGNTASKEKLAQLAKWCKECGHLLIIDEAWGDFLPDDNSAANLTENYDNIAVLRSTSKGLGVAGLRVGYAIASPNVGKIMQKVALPHKLNSFQQQLINTVLRPRSIRPHLNLVREIAENATRRLREGIDAIDAADPDTMKRIFYVWPNDDRIPMLFVEDGVDNLPAILRTKYFIYTAEGEGFSSTARIGNEAARITVPLLRREREKIDVDTKPKTYKLRKKNKQRILSLTYGYIDELLIRLRAFTRLRKKTQET